MYRPPQATAVATTDGGAGRSSDSGLLVLDEFLSFVDEVGDVVDASGQRPSFTIPDIPEPVPLAGPPSDTGALFGPGDAEAFYQAMQPDEDQESPGSPDSASHMSWASSSDGAAAATADTSSLPPVKEKKKRRRRQKEELDYLRVRVKEMEDELARLRGEEIAGSAIAVGTARAMHLLPPTSIDQLPSGDENDGDGSVEGASIQRKPQPQLWERVAGRQKQATQQAVMENIRLRALLEGQISVARSLETALRKKPRFASADLNPYIGKGSTIRLDGADEQKIYDSIGLQLDVLYAQVDLVLVSSGIVDVHSDKVFGAQVRADESGMFVEHKEARVVPFDVHAVGRAVWKTLGRESMPLRNGVYIAREATDDTVCAKVVDTFRLPKAKSETVVTIRLVLKRFIEEHRVVSVWESMVETVGPVCLRLREKAWNVLRPLAADGQLDEDGQPKQLCLAHSIIRVWPEMASSDSGDNTEVGTLTNLVVGSYQRNLGIMAQIIQNLLTDEAKSRGSDGSDRGSS